MSTTANAILNTALALSRNERAWLASELIASLDESKDSDVEAAWAAEIDRRIAEVESGEIETSSWEESVTRTKTVLASRDQTR